MTRRGWELSPADDNLVSMDDVVIEVNGLRRSYREFEAVRGISLRIRRGELFALLGTNGAGKTTTIEVLEGLQPATAGRVRVLGLDPVQDRYALRPRTGVMLQHGGFTGALTVRETVEIWRSLTVRPQTTAEVLDLVDLGGRRNVAVEQLSGGEGRRLELALAVLGRPEVLFLDEPTAGMDPASRRRTWDVVRELQRGGTTILLTTHYLEEAEVLADRVAIMRRGSIVATGAPEDVVRTLPARISFRPPATDALPDLPHAARLVEGDRVSYESRQLQTDLTRLLEWASAGNIRLTSLSARPATLEDVFLDIAADHDPTDRYAESEAAR
ncbi:ABC transporter ATP-binding protein [Plantactinospora sp. BB1]|uniref:ABC transporter ATP-binding protein n=1 Tax=Plantactinospora sp. BB1 TaxID=2071627 RepID=UPI001F3CDFA2|nr:ABC transporter ATP-binding protein [Plantactinospora sp. BB1]